MSERQIELFTPLKVQHLFLQFFLHKQCITEEELNKLILAYKRRLPKESADFADKKYLLNKSNKTLRTLGFQIKQVFDEFTNQYFFIFVNDIDDLACQQSAVSKHENKFFFLLVDEIVNKFLSDEAPMDIDSGSDFDFMAIRNITAANLTRTAGLTMILGEKILNEWINLHWFERNSSGHITLGIRTFIEKNSYLIEKFNLLPCYVCHFVCVFGRTCSKCKINLHKHCSFSSKSQKGVFSCPSCSSRLSDPCLIIPPNTEVAQQDETQSEGMAEESQDIANESEDMAQDSEDMDQESEDMAKKCKAIKIA